MTFSSINTFRILILVCICSFIILPKAKAISFDPGFSDWVVNTLQGNLLNRIASGSDNNSTPIQDPKPTEMNDLIYKYNEDIHNQGRQFIIDYYDKISPELADVLRKTDLVKIYRKNIFKQGFDKNSITDADAYLWIQAWQIVHYKEDPDITPEMIEAVRRQFRAIGIDRKFHELRDGFKQIYAEARITQAMLILSLLQHGLQSNDKIALANMIQAARGSVEGIDNYKLTNKGFEVKKETLTTEGAQLTDVYFNRLSSVSITKSVTQQSNVASTVVLVKTANDQWYQRHADGSFSTWDLQLASLKNNKFSSNTGGVVFFDIAASLDLSSAPELFPLTVYIGNIYNDGQLNWGYFNVMPL